MKSVASLLAGSALALLAPLSGQSERTPAFPLLRPPDSVSPWRAFQHLRQGNATRLTAAKRVEPRPHPFGPGRFVAAIATPSGLRFGADEIFAARHRDLLVFSSPGPSLRNAEIAALEQTVAQDHLSLLVILVDAADPTLAQLHENGEPADPTQRRLLAAARTLAARREVTIPAAYAMMQADRIWLRSPRLAELQAEGRFQVALGIIEDKSAGISWVTKWHDRWQLVSSVSAKAAMQLRPPNAPAGKKSQKKERDRHPR